MCTLIKIFMTQSQMKIMKTEPIFRQHLEHFNDKVNTGGKIYVIPPTLWPKLMMQYNGLELIQNYESANNYYHTWRKRGYKDILLKFRLKYNIDYFQDPVGYTDSKKFMTVGGDQTCEVKGLRY